MKITFLGFVGSGKSAIIRRLLNLSFENRYTPTIEEHYNFVVRQPGGLCCVQDIVDTSGTDEFPVMRELRIKQSDVFVVVYSVTSMKSFDYAKRMCSEITTIKGRDDVPVVLVGNKTDLTSGREVEFENGYKMMTERDTCYFVETSARLSDNIQEIMNILLLHDKPNLDQNNFKERLSKISNSQRVVDNSVLKRNISVVHSFNLWNTPVIKHRKKLGCFLM